MRRRQFCFSNSNHHNYFFTEVSLFRIIMIFVIEKVKLGMPRAMGEDERDRCGKSDREEGRRLYLHNVNPP